MAVSTSVKLQFSRKLVLHQWLLSLFGITNFERLAEGLKGPELEGFDENNISRYHHAIRARFHSQPELSTEQLLGYDQNIVRHWKRITEKRNHQGHSLHPKYFQYLALLFTEIYLDHYFRDSERLLASLNSRVAYFNADKAGRDRVKAYEAEDLNKVAFWMATGSGKTLLMHVNILQYQHYLELHGQEKRLSRTILLTPNEGLSHQHLGEFQRSGIPAELFQKEGRGIFSGRAVEIIDIHKLRGEAGEKTVAVEAFEGNNLVLVDEGHRGTSGTQKGQWMQKRNQLCEHGFSFEYSATFGQAMKASGNRELERTYARCILFDYSYRFFYEDGYGKEYRILNLEDDSDESVRRRYLTACLLAFYQQQKLCADRRDEFLEFLLECPLWIFVGGSVNAVRTQNRRKVSDVVDILLFLTRFVRERSESIGTLDRFLSGQSGLLDARGSDLFADAFPYLVKEGMTADAVYDDILAKLEEIKGLIESGEFRDVQFQGLRSIPFDRHLYQPLVYVKSDVIEVKPVALNEGERDFVLDLRAFCEENQDYFKDKELYLLRNQSRGRGLGFFEAGNFYPDFILWLVVGQHQTISFVDPKGLRNTEGIHDPRIQFYRSIKDLQALLGDPDVTLNSFIVSGTPHAVIRWWSDGMTKAQFEEHHVLFQEEEGYIQKILSIAEQSGS